MLMVEQDEMIHVRRHVKQKFRRINCLVCQWPDNHKGSAVTDRLIHLVFLWDVDLYQLPVFLYFILHIRVKHKSW